MASFIPIMTLHPNPPQYRSTQQSQRRPHAQRVVQRVQAAVRDDHLGLALNLLNDNPYLRLPDHLADELAGKLRLRGVRPSPNVPDLQLGEPEMAALNLLSRNHYPDTAEDKQEAAKLVHNVDNLIRKGVLNQAFKAVDAAPREHVDVNVLEKLIKGAGDVGQIRKAGYVLERLFPRFGKHPSPRAYSLFVDACGRVGNFRLAISTLSSSNFPCLDKLDQSKVYERVVNACVLCKELDQAEKIVLKMKSAGIPRTENIYVNLVGGSARTRPVDRSINILRLMRADGFTPHIGTYNAMVWGCARAGRLRDAMSFYDTIAESGTMRLNLDTFNALLCCCARARDPNTAFDILDKMKNEAGISPNAKSYNWVVVACGRVGEVDRAFQIAEVMRKEGIRLNVVTNNNLLEACCNAGRLERAFGLVKEMIQNHGLRPNSHTYNTLIRGIGRWGQLDAALRMLGSMRKAGVAPTVITYSIAVDACARAGGAVALDQAFELVKEMREAGLEPNKVTYNSLIHACARANNADRAFKVLQRMRSEKIAPDIVTMCTLVDACGRSGNVDRAFKVITELPQEFSALRPTVAAYNALLHACFKAGDVMRMKLALREMIRLELRPNVVTYSTLISAYVAHGDTKKALDLLKEMTQVGLKPNRMTYTSIIAGYGHLGDVDSAMNVFKEAKLTTGEPDEELYTASIVAAISGGREELAVKLAKEMTRAGYSVPTVLNRMMRRVGDIERSGDELRNILRAMEALNIRPQRAAIDSLIAAYTKEAQVAAVFAVVLDMDRLGYPPNLSTYKRVVQACELSGKACDIYRAYAVFSKLRSRVRDGDRSLRSHHWVELYEAMIRAASKLKDLTGEEQLKTDLLEWMATDCGAENATRVSQRLASGTDGDC